MSGGDIVPAPPGVEEAKTPFTIVAKSADMVSKGHRIVRFRGRAMVEVYDGYPHFVPLHKDRFEKLAYPVLGGVSRSRISDVFSFVCNTAEDLGDSENLILFGVPIEDTEVQADTDLEFLMKNTPTVWDMDALQSIPGAHPDRCVWRSPYAKIASVLPGQGDKAGTKHDRLDFIMSLAGGDEDLYDDIMQSIAPIIMARKPDGVIWWVGDGANGKSTLMDALYKIFPGQLSSITVKRLTDGRDTPSLNGTLANIVKESSEGRIDDTEIYKSIGTHENFRVHKFHSQDDIEIRGNVHHIFSANQIPTFNDKGYAARRRTFIVPFTQRFASDPMFEEKTFTPEMFGRLVQEMCRYAVQIKRQGYRYKWSAKTLAAKASYDAEASNAEEYGRHIIGEGVVAFAGFGPLKIDYENWCADMGYVPLGVGNLRRAIQTLGFERVTDRGDGKQYRLPNISSSELQALGMSRPGLYTTPGFRPERSEADKPKKEVPAPGTTLGGKW